MPDYDYENPPTTYGILMCSIYCGDDIEQFYNVGSFINGKFYKGEREEEEKEVCPTYWAKINEPHSWECED